MDIVDDEFLKATARGLSNLATRSADAISPDAAPPGGATTTVGTTTTTTTTTTKAMNVNDR